MWPKRIQNMEEPGERWSRGHREKGNSTNKWHQVSSRKFPSCQQRILTMPVPSDSRVAADPWLLCVLWRSFFWREVSVVVILSWICSGLARVLGGLREDNMSISSWAVRSHRAKSRSQREACAASALDFELDETSHFLPLEDEYAQYLIAREGRKYNQDSSRKAGFRF